MGDKIFDVIVPDLGGDDSSPMTLVEWLVEVGKVVGVGDLLYALETDKAVFEVESEVSGRLSEILQNAGDLVAAGQIAARIAVG